MKKRRIRRRPVPEVPHKRGLFLLPKLKRTSIELKLSSVPITGTPRKLLVRWDISNPTETIHEHGVTYRLWH